MDRNFIDNSFILKYHLNLINGAGINSAQAVGWRSKNGQLARFAILSQIADMTNSSVLDAGCGTGDLCDLLTAKYTELQYTGIDIMEHFLNTAVARHYSKPNTTFLLGDMGHATLPLANYVLVSGALNYRRSEENYLYRMINKLYNCANKAFAFNLLSGLPEATPLLCTYNPETIVAYCRMQSPNVQLAEGYYEGDFTIIMYR